VLFRGDPLIAEYKTSAGFTLLQLEEACEYLWRVLPKNTGMQDAADTLLGYIRTLKQAPGPLPSHEAITLLKAWTTDRLIRYETTPRSIGWNSYDMAHTMFYKMFLAMSSRQFPSLIDAQMVYYSLKYRLDHETPDAPMTAGFRRVVEEMKGRLEGWSFEKKGQERATDMLREQCLTEIEVCLQHGSEEAIHAYAFILALFH
jgi:hypothetical protein